MQSILFTNYFSCANTAAAILLIFVHLLFAFISRKKGFAFEMDKKAEINIFMYPGWLNKCPHFLFTLDTPWLINK
jgi:hypothetical protein